MSLTCSNTAHPSRSLQIPLCQKGHKEQPWVSKSLCPWWHCPFLGFILKFLPKQGCEQVIGGGNIFPTLSPALWERGWCSIDAWEWAGLEEFGSFLCPCTCRHGTTLLVKLVTVKEATALAYASLYIYNLCTFMAFFLKYTGNRKWYIFCIKMESNCKPVICSI